MVQTRAITGVPELENGIDRAPCRIPLDHVALFVYWIARSFTPGAYLRFRSYIHHSLLPPFAHTEFELSAQDQASAPPLSLYEAIISTIAPYVPATMMKHPKAITKIAHPAFHHHVLVLLEGTSLSAQLSYSHIPPVGWKVISGTKSAPISETSPPKMGTALAMM